MPESFTFINTTNTMQMAALLYTFDISTDTQLKASVKGSSEYDIKFSDINKLTELMECVKK